MEIQTPLYTLGLEETREYYYKFGNHKIYFHEECLSLGTMLPKEGVPELNISQATGICLEVLKKFQDDAKKIEESPIGVKLSTSEEIDLSNLNLTSIPPHIILQMKSVRKLNIADNHICHLPVEIQKLSNLEKLDISGNRHLQPRIPDWIGERMPNLTLIGNRINLHFVPTGMKHANVISDALEDIPYEDYCKTQLLLSSGSIEDSV